MNRTVKRKGLARADAPKVVTANVPEGEPRITWLGVKNSSDTGDPVKIMSSVGFDSSKVKLNAQSISDNNGGRITLNKEDYVRK